MFSRAALNAFVSVTIGLSGGGPVGARVGATAGFAVLAGCLGAGLVLGASLGGVTVISGSVAWPRAHCTAAWTASALDTSNSIRRKGGRIVSSPDARTRVQHTGEWRTQTASDVHRLRRRARAEGRGARCGPRPYTQTAGAMEYVVLGRIRSGPTEGMSVEAT